MWGHFASRRKSKFRRSTARTPCRRCRRQAVVGVQSLEADAVSRVVKSSNSSWRQHFNPELLPCSGRGTSTRNHRPYIGPGVSWSRIAGLIDTGVMSTEAAFFVLRVGILAPLICHGMPQTQNFRHARRNTASGTLCVHQICERQHSSLGYRPPTPVARSRTRPTIEQSTLMH